MLQVLKKDKYFGRQNTLTTDAALMSTVQNFNARSLTMISTCYEKSFTPSLHLQKDLLKRRVPNEN